MQYRDCRNLSLTAASPEVTRLYDETVERIARYHADPFAPIERALALDPLCTAVHCARAAIGVMSAERAAETLIRDSLAAARGLPANERELRHFGAAEAWLSGDFHRAADLYAAISLDYPRDLLALQVTHVCDFYLGRQRLLRDHVAHALSRFGERTPGVGYLHGMLAFGLEEANLFGQAEAAAELALQHDRRDVWAIHAWAHCFEMTGRVDAGAEFLGRRRPDFSVDNGFAFHNYWHLALFELERGNVQEVLRLFDLSVWPRSSGVALEMVDAASLLFRLYLRGVDVGARAASVATGWREPAQHGYYAFNDAHAVMAYIVAGELAEARRHVHQLELVAGDDSSNASMTRDVGLPLCRALVAFAEQDYARTVEILWALRLDAQRFGGSNAQRDLLDQTLAEAAVRAGNHAIVRALAAERRILRPHSTWAAYLDRALLTSRVA